MAQPPTRTTETMMAELVHHMAELVKAQAETNRLLQELLKASGK
ncbi:hypothetical protein [Pararoseomonas baculiformis]|nr:hypothetical protein [Pararoseomonas baculiformis]